MGRAIAVRADYSNGEVRGFDRRASTRRFLVTQELVIRPWHVGKETAINDILRIRLSQLTVPLLVRRPLVN